MLHLEAIFKVEVPNSVNELIFVFYFYPKVDSWYVFKNNEVIIIR